MALKVAEVLIKWRGEGAQQVEADTKKLGSALTDLGDKAKNAGAVLSAGLTAPLVLIGKQAIDAASDLNESMSAVETVFGSTADQVLTFSRTAASQLGQSRQAALSAASAMGALFKGVGLTEQQMADFSTSLLTAAADLGSFYNVDPGVALDKIRSGLVGEVEGLRQFGILLNAADVEARALALGLADANGEISEGAKVQARYSLIMEQLGAAQGDFARTSDGLANSQRILAARLQDIRAEIGSYLLPYALRASEAFSGLLDRFLGLSDQAKGLGVALGAVAAAAGPVLVIAGQLMSSVGSLAPLLAALTGPLGLVAAGVVALGLAFKNNWFGIRDLVTQVVDRVGNTIGRMVQFFQHAKDRGLNPFRLAFRTLIVALGENLGKDHPLVEFLQQVLRFGERLKTAFDTQGFAGVVDELMRTAGRLSNWGEEQLGNVKTFAATFLTSLVAGFQSVNWDLVGNTIREGLTAAASAYGDLHEKARAFAGGLVQNIVQGFQGINWDIVGGAIMSGLQSALTALGQLGLWILDRLKEVDWNGIATSAADLAKFIGVMINTGVRNGVLALMELGGWILEQLNKVNWQSISDELMRRGQDISSSLQRGIQSVWDLIILPWFQGLHGNIQTLFAEAGRWLVSNGASLLSGLYDGALSIWNATLKPWIDGLQSLIQGVFANAGTWLTEQGSAILDGLRHGIQDYWNNTLSPWMGGMKTSFGNFFSGAGSWLTDTGTSIIQGLWDGISSKWKELEDWVAGLSLPWPDFSIPGIGGGGGGGGRREEEDTARAMGGPLGKRYTLVGEYGPELLINRSLVMPHGAAQSRIQAMGGMAYGGTGSWGAWLDAQDSRTRRAIRAMRQQGLLNADVRSQLMKGLNVPAFNQAMGGGRYGYDRESRRAERESDAAWRAERRAARNNSRNSDALNRANDYGDRTGDYSRRDRVLAREARSGRIHEGGLSRQEKQYLISNYGSINVYAKDANVARAIGDQLSSRDR